jgi:hypothetical protein
MNNLKVNAKAVNSHELIIKTYLNTRDFRFVNIKYLTNLNLN